MSVLLNYLNEHNNWIEELSMPPYNIKVTQDGKRYLLKYNQLSSDFNNEIVRECRGCIVKQDTESGRWVYITHALNKFGNYGESYCGDIDWRNASVQEKIDGSLIKFSYDDYWLISTNSTIDAFNAPTGNALYPTFGVLVIEALHKYFGDEHLFLSQLDKNCTYWFELVSPYTQVVIPYKEIDMYFLGWRDKFDDKELDPLDCKLHDLMPNPKRYPLSTLDEVRAAANELGHDDEGFVVCDHHFNRLKIKNPMYVLAHHMRNNGVVTNERLIQIVLDNEEEEFLIYCPEYKELIDKINQWIYNSYIDAINELDDVLHEWHVGDYTQDQKGFAQAVYAVASPAYRAFLFEWYKHLVTDGGYQWREFTSDWSAAKWKKFLSPWLD